MLMDVENPFIRRGGRGGVSSERQHRTGLEVPALLPPRCHIPFPGPADEAVCEPLWLGRITLLNGDRKGNVVSWKVSSKYMGMELLKETWSWKHFPSEKHFQSVPQAKCNNSSDIIITKGEKVILPTCCCDFSILKPHLLWDLEVMWFHMQASSQGMLLGHVSTSTYDQVIRCQECFWQQKNELKDVFFYLGPSLYLLIYVEYIARNCLQYMTSFFLLSVMSQYLDMRENSVWKPAILPFDVANFKFGRILLQLQSLFLSPLNTLHCTTN